MASPPNLTVDIRSTIKFYQPSLPPLEFAGILVYQLPPSSMLPNTVSPTLSMVDNIQAQTIALHASDDLLKHMLGDQKQIEWKNVLVQIPKTHNDRQQQHPIPITKHPDYPTNLQIFCKYIGAHVPVSERSPRPYGIIDYYYFPPIPQPSIILPTLPIQFPPSVKEPSRTNKRKKLSTTTSDTVDTESFSEMMMNNKSDGLPIKATKSTRSKAKSSSTGSLSSMEMINDPHLPKTNNHTPFIFINHINGGPMIYTDSQMKLIEHLNRYNRHESLAEDPHLIQIEEICNKCRAVLCQFVLKHQAKIITLWIPITLCILNPKWKALLLSFMDSKMQVDVEQDSIIQLSSQTHGHKPTE